MELTEKVRNLYGLIKNRFYMCRNDMTVGGQKFNAALALGVLTELNRATMIYYGEYSLGKTTLSQYLHSLFNNWPLELVRRKATLKGTPQLTEEKIVAFPEYGLMNSGDPRWKDKVVFLHFCMIPDKICNELPRIPESTQTLLLDNIESGEWGYLRGSIDYGQRAVFFTANYEDAGSNGVIPALIDRIHVAAESKDPGTSNKRQIVRDFHNDVDRALRNPELYMEILKILNSDCEYEEILESLKMVQERHCQELAKRGIFTLSDAEKRQAEKEIAAIPFSKDADIYQCMLMSELGVHPMFGSKRSIDEVTTDFGRYLYACYKGADTIRGQRALYRYAQGLAWLQGEKEVSLEHVLAIAPYVMWHRIRWEGAVLQHFRQLKREDGDADRLDITKRMLGDGDDEYPGVKKRFMEQKDNYHRIQNMVGEAADLEEQAEQYRQKGRTDVAELKLAEARQKEDETLNLCREYSQDGKGHPVFIDLAKDIEEGMNGDQEYS